MRSNQGKKPTGRPISSRMGKAQKVSVSIPPEMIGHAERCAEIGGGLSKYIQSLIEADMDGAIAPEKTTADSTIRDILRRIDMLENKADSGPNLRDMLLRLDRLEAKIG